MSSVAHVNSSPRRVCLWSRLCPLYLLACQVRVTIGSSGLCSVYVMAFEHLLAPFVFWCYTGSLGLIPFQIIIGFMTKTIVIQTRTEQSKMCISQFKGAVHTSSSWLIKRTHTHTHTHIMALESLTVTFLLSRLSFCPLCIIEGLWKEGYWCQGWQQVETLFRSQRVMFRIFFLFFSDYFLIVWVHTTLPGTVFVLCKFCISFKTKYTGKEVWLLPLFILLPTHVILPLLWLS